jgi:hypothetical protein
MNIFLVSKYIFVVHTIAYGKCLMAEVGGSINFRPVGIGESYTENYFEISVEKFKLNNFELNEKDKKYCLRKLKIERVLKEK